MCHKYKKDKLGPGVTSPRSRIAPITARAMATLNELAPGRCIMGFGTGNTARRAWETQPQKSKKLGNMSRGHNGIPTRPHREGGENGSDSNYPFPRRFIYIGITNTTQSILSFCMRGSS